MPSMTSFKAQLYNPFFLVFGMLECSYFTALSGQTDRHYFPTGDYFDLTDNDTYQLHGDGSKNENAEELRR